MLNALIALMSTRKLTLVFMITRTLYFNFVDFVGIKTEPLVHYQTLDILIHNSKEGAPSRT